MSAAALESYGMVPADGGMEPFDFSAAPGAVVCVLGREPHARSAYLRAFAGAEYPAAGTVAMLGRRLEELDDRAWLALRREVGYVTRDVALVSAMDGLRNVMLPALYHGLGRRAAVEAQARELLARLGFTGDPQLLPAYLSDAQRKVVALARALMLGPKLLLLDDLLQGWHAQAVRTVIHTVGEWCRERGATLVHATDDAVFVRAFADALIFVAPPRPRVFGSWSEFHDADDPEVARYFSEFRTEAQAFD